MLVDQHGRPLAPRTAQSNKPLRARYDAASYDLDNANHWAMADSLSSVRANSEDVRRKLRERSRYEVSNNSYARGAIDTIANYTIGQGPTLQLTYRGEGESDDHRMAAQAVEMAWADWAYVRRLHEKLWTASVATDVDGEAFGLLVSAEETRDTPVTLDVRLYECDQFADPDAGITAEDDSGVRLVDGEPAEYAMLDRHPGDDGMFTGLSGRWLPASQVLHCFRSDRAGQVRGIPRTTPALPLFAQLRRYILATITAAETAADFAAILYQDAAPDDADTIEPWDRLPIERGAMLSVPGGSRLAQLKAEHPTVTFDEFVKAILREIARCLGIPAVLMLGDASGYNYASGRLDLQSFHRSMSVDRCHLLERPFLDRIFEAWLAEAVLIGGFLPELDWREWDFGWRWSEPEHVDRKKEADGQAVELSNHTTTLSREYAKRGLNWETELKQRAREVQAMKELGLTMAQAAPQDTPEDEGE